MKNTSQNILVTGAAGFIGSHLVERLVSENHQVIAVDNLSTGRMANLNHLLGQIEFIECDLTSTAFLAKLFSRSPKIDYVFHLAAIPSVVRSIENPRASHENNIDLSFNLLMVAKEFGVKRLIYSGSSSAYGQQETELKYEALPAQPISPYALQKWVGEKYAHFFNEFFGLETIVLRYFNVFGPRQNPHSMYSGVIPRFIKLALNDDPVIVHGDGQQARDFTYVSNVVDANIKAMLAPKECCGQTFNAAMGESTSLLTLIEMLETVLEKKISIKFESSRNGDIKYSKASTVHAEKMLGYRGIVGLKQGLANTVEFIKNYEME